jgi:phosphoglucosamine mutase
MDTISRRLFGTDGIRGVANRAPMDATTALRLGQAAGSYFSRGAHRHRVVIGKDTRLSGYMLEPALTAGFVGAGMDVVLVGPLPTPAIALLTRSMRADLGVMISASHNPYEDNGIKLFGPDGLKLSDAQEAAIEALMAGAPEAHLASPAKLGRANRLDDAPGRYLEAVKATFPKGLSLDGLRIVVDCANGAAYRVAPTVLWELGAEVVSIGVAPDGFNINSNCGSTAPERLAETVRERRADLGVALDGDADRLVLVDERGRVVDGDQVLALIAESWLKQERLKGGAVVATVMSNLGLERRLEGLGLRLLRTKVGDRHVGERMRETGCNLGGEQSGHVIMSDFATTGDGLVAALQVLAVLAKEGRPASEICRSFTPLPQRLANVRYAGGAASPLDDPAVRQEIAAAEARLGSGGRVLIRRSGTEPVVRVMAEAEDEALVAEVVEGLAEAIRARAAAMAASITAPPAAASRPHKAGKVPAVVKGTPNGRAVFGSRRRPVGHTGANGKAPPASL